MAFELTENESEDLVTRTKKLLETLADAWDPEAGKTAEVLNSTLQEADALSARWAKVKWGKQAR